jgi:2-polyprenyl-3-methyl-5-hydroxy-6-metoxy-1,4-benzoquinol methylase
VDQFNNDFALHWDELVGWDARSAEETDFLVNLLSKYNCKNVLDVALGTGFHSIELLKRGIKVKSIDVSPAMIEVANKNAKFHSVELDVLCTEWSELKKKVFEKFDCIICLGNSLACEMSHTKRQEAIENWVDLLSENGVILVDRRNYEALLNNNYNFSSKGQYFGKTVTIKSIVSDHETEFFYTFADGKTFTLKMYPLLEKEMSSLFKNENFYLLETYGDRVLSSSGSNIGFYLSIFRKSTNAKL